MRSPAHDPGFLRPAIHCEGREGTALSRAADSSPINLHIHGVHVSPKGNADNVMLHIPPGMSNTYTYNIPKNMPQGAYWYHSHLHTLTTAQTYYGLAGLLAIGRTDGNIPLVTANQDPDPEHGPAVQLRVRSEGGARPAQQCQLAAIRQHAQAAGRRRTGEWHISSVAGADQFRSVEVGDAVLHRVVLGPAVDPQYPRAVPVHPEQSAAIHRRGKTGNDAGRSGAPRLSARRAVHGQRPVPAGHQEQSRTDRDLGARQCQRHRLHERSAHRDGDRAGIRRSPSSGRTEIHIPRFIIPSTDDGTRLLIPPATASRLR